MSNNEKKWIVLVNIAGWSGKWRPFVKELSRDRPKTIFTKSSFGSESRYRKVDIKYQIFDSAVDACSAVDITTRMAIDRHTDDIHRTEASKKIADAAVQEAMKTPAWLGGLK